MKMEDRVLIFAVVLMFAVSIQSRPFCKDINQTERYNIKGEIICCYTAVCKEGHKFLLCKEDGGHDSCQKCPVGFTHGDIINTKVWKVEIDPCEEEIKCEDYGADHVVINGVCSCDRFHGFYGHDINMCQIDQGNCKMAGYELAVNAKDRLFNSIVQQLDDAGDKFPSVFSDKTIREQLLMPLVNSIYYISGNMETIMERSQHLTEVVGIPNRFRQFDGVNDYKRKKMKRPCLSAKDLKLHSECLFRICNKAFMRNWRLHDDIETLAFCLDSYAGYLDKANTNQQHRQEMSHPVRQIDTHMSIEYIEKTDSVSSKYSKIEMALSEMPPFKPLYFDEDSLGCEGMPKYKFLLKLALSFDIHMLKYDPGAGLGGLTFFWRVSENMSSKDIFMMDNQVLHDLRPKLPVYHTRKMRKEFYQQYEHLSGVSIPPHILRSIYSMLTGDATVDQNPALDQRVRLAVWGSDPELITDLRHINKGRPADTFNDFYDALEQELEDLKAADERRHGVEHVAKYLSVRDMINQVKAKLPEETPVPSESSVLLAFVPKNAHANVAKLYKGRIQLRMKVQTRQLRASHQDEHYCASIFKLLREYAVRFRDLISFVCMDDKSKVDFGEPGVHISSGVRGRKSIMPVDSSLSCLDHDVSSKGSLTPSVILNVDIPENITESFYRGEVTVTFKESIFQPSTPFRHVVELKKVLTVNEMDVKPALFIYTDGGPDHRTTYHSVKLSLIILFKQLKLEFLVACRTAPGHSWANPAERIMSVLNIAFQNTALSRAETTSELEQTLRSCSSMSDIRQKAERVADLKVKWKESLSPMVATLEDRTKRMQLKGKSFKVSKAADDDEVEMLEAEVTLVDPSILVGSYQKAQLGKARMYKEFLANHCRERQYTFQIKRCNNPDCCEQNGTEWEWLPDPVIDGTHYKCLDATIGTVTSEKDRPSNLNQTVAAVAQEQQGCDNRVLVAQNARTTVKCTECDKPRIIYSRLKLSARDMRSIKHMTEKYDYTCGALFTTEGSCQQCDHDHFKEKDGEYGLCREKTRCSADQEIDYPGSISSDRTCKTRITSHTEQPSILTSTNETISSKNKTFTPSMDTNSTMSRNTSSSSKESFGEKTTLGPGNKNIENTTKTNDQENEETDNRLWVALSVFVVGIFVIVLVFTCKKKTCMGCNSCICYAKIVNLYNHGGNIQVGDNNKMIAKTYTDSDFCGPLMSWSDE